MHLLQLLLVGEGALRDGHQVVRGQIEEGQLRVELDGRVDGLDLVALDHQSLDGGVQGDGQHVQLALAALNHQGIIIALTTGRAIGQTRRRLHSNAGQNAPDAHERDHHVSLHLGFLVFVFLLYFSVFSLCCCFDSIGFFLGIFSFP